MQESQVSMLKYILNLLFSLFKLQQFSLLIFTKVFLFLSRRYTLFWVLVLLSKFSFSYYFEVKTETYCACSVLYSSVKHLFSVGN